MKPIVLAVVAALVLPLPAAAQQTGTRLNRSAGQAKTANFRDPDSAVRIANQFAQCLARREVRTVKSALDLPLASNEQRRGLYRNVAQYDDCLGNANEEWSDLQTPPLLLAGGAAEYFVNTEYKSADLKALSNLSEEALAKSPLKPRTGLEDLGLCLVRRDPTAVRALLATKVTTKAEAAAARAMTPAVGACVAQGQSFSLATPSLRAVVAYAAYRAASKGGGGA